MTDQPRREEVPRAVRLLFEYEGTRVVLRQVQQLETATPPSDPTRGFEDQSGFWYELRDKKGDLLYRRVVANPIRIEVEAHDPETGFTRRAVNKPSGSFTVLLPDMTEATDVVLMGSALKAENNAGRAQRLVSFPLKGEPRKRGR